MSDFSEQEIEALRRVLTQSERRESLGDMGSDGYFDELFDRPHMMAALITLLPKSGESWTEERLLLWLEVAEKTARLVYGLRSEWTDILGVESPPQRKRADVASDKIEAASEAPPSETAQAEVQVDASDSSTSNEEAKPEVAAERSRPDRALEALKDGPLRLKDLAARIDAPSGSMSALADSLEVQGLAKSSWDDNGARTVALADPDEPKAPPPCEADLEQGIMLALDESWATLKRHEIAEKLGVEPEALKTPLANLRAGKQIEKCGESSGTSYRIPARPNGDVPLASRVVEVISRDPCDAPRIIQELGVPMNQLSPVLNGLIETGEIVWNDDAVYAVAAAQAA